MDVLELETTTSSETTHNFSYMNYSGIYNGTETKSTWQKEAICSPTSSDTFITSRTFISCVYIMYTVVFLFALIGNSLVCYMIQSSPKMKTVTNFFIMNLAIGDILMTIFCVPFSFVSMLVLRYWPFGMAMCKLVNYSQAVSVFVSAYTLLAISIDRYMAIMRPLRPRLSKTSAKLVITFVWGGALTTAAPIFIVSRIEKPTDWHQFCNLDICREHWDHVERSKQYTCALMVLQFGLPLSVLLYTYARIAQVVWGGRPPGEAESVRDNRMRQSKRKMVKMMITVVVVFIISWLPLNLFIVLWTINEPNEEWAMWPGMPLVWFLCHWMAMSHCCYNPVIYCYMNSRFRHGFKQILGCNIHWQLENTSRMCQRSSVCDGVPLSDIQGGNSAVRLSHTCSSVGRSRGRSNARRASGNIRSTSSLRSAVTPPVRSVSVRTNF